MFLKIAVVQFAINQFAPEKNLAKAEQFIAEASSENDLIVFPEDFMVGPLNGRNEFADYGGHYVKHFQQLASKYHIDIVPGSIIEGDLTGLYNTAYYIDRSGEIRGRYRKINLWLPERSYVTPGSSISVFESRFGRIGPVSYTHLTLPTILRV